MLISSRRRWALMVERPVDREPPLDEVLLELDQELLDLILVEGFKHERFPKIELHRPSFGRPLLHPRDDTIVAIATDAPLDAPVLAAHARPELAGGYRELRHRHDTERRRPAQRQVERRAGGPEPARTPR